MDTKTYEYLTERTLKYEKLKTKAKNYEEYISNLIQTSRLSLGLSNFGSIYLDENCTEKIKLATLEILKERIAEMEKEMEEI